MSLYTMRISDANRIGLSVPPPPEYNKRGEFVGDDLSCREQYKNAAVLKKKGQLYGTYA